jgi:DtxR family Mn-dependent transcriptional regulator
VRITISKENYLKAILEAEAEGETVIAATLARWLRVSAPAVATAVRRLQRDGLIAVRKTGEIVLTPAGREIATRLFARHQLIERMLAEVFGMEWFRVHDEAEQLEHAVSADFERLLVEKLGPAGRSPLGGRTGLISAQERRQRGWRPLAEIGAETSAEIQTILDRDRALLEYLDRLELRPGVAVEVTARNVDQTITLRVRGKPVQLGLAAAGKIWVRPLAAEQSAGRL